LDVATNRVEGHLNTMTDAEVIVLVDKLGNFPAGGALTK